MSAVFICIFWFSLYMVLLISIVEGRHFSKIVGGKSTNISSVPYQVCLRYDYVHICGGSIIGPSTVLTAAHCVQKGHMSDYSVRGGSDYYMLGGKVRQVIKIITHPSYNPYTKDYDIAVLHLKEPFQWTNTIEMIGLSTKEPKKGEQILVSGWGGLYENSSFHTTLRSVIIPAVPRKTCQNAYKKITKNMFCAGFTNGGKDSCQGDSGGPAVLISSGKQVGIVSWGKGCGKKSFPGVYTSIPKLWSWIMNLII